MAEIIERFDGQNARRFGETTIFSPLGNDQHDVPAAEKIVADDRANGDR